MATILEFSTRAAEAEDRFKSDRTPRAGMNSAQIIIFPGVRIERYDVDPFEDLVETPKTVARRKSLQD